MIRYLLRAVALGYLALLLVAPLGMVFVRAFDDGFDAFWAVMQHPDLRHALGLTMIATGVSVICNTVFGIAAALVLVRGSMRGRRLLNVLIDIPFAISPVIVGLALVLTYGVQGWFGEWFVDHGLPIIFSLPGIVLATVFVTLPFVAREVIPVLQEVGDEQEQAAVTLGASGWVTFWRVTLPSIRWGVAYGIVLTTARALGEYGAVAVVSGRLRGQTETMTTYIKERYEGFDVVAVYAASVVLAAIALIVLGAMSALGTRHEGGGHGH